LPIEHMYDRAMTAVMVGTAGGSQAPGLRLACRPAGLEALAAAVEELVLAPTGEAIERALWLADRLQAKISKALQGFSAAEGYGQDGSLSLTAWLGHHGRLPGRDAHRQARSAVRLGRLPGTEAAWQDGTLSSGHVAAVLANTGGQLAELYAGHEGAMTANLAQLSAGEAALAMRTWRLRAEALLDQAPAPERPSELYLSRTLDGRRELSGHLCAEDAAALEEALAAAQPGPAGPSGQGPAPSAAQRRAEALAEVCRWFLANSAAPSSGSRNRPQVSVLVSLEDLAGGGPGHLADGTAVGGATVGWLACDCELHRIVVAGRSTVLDYGSSVRTINRSLWAALVARDGHCRHPGCDRPPSWCEGHHIVHFSKGGPTRLDNLALACSRHHHLWHDQGWHLELGPDATLALTSPEGLVLTSQPRPARLVC
jgi:hypothetical protein